MILAGVLSDLKGKDVIVVLDGAVVAQNVSECEKYLNYIVDRLYFDDEGVFEYIVEISI